MKYRSDTFNGDIVGKLDLTSFANEAKNLYSGSKEMNGIAYDPETRNVLITGKLWPRIYEIRIVDQTSNNQPS